MGDVGAPVVWLKTCMGFLFISSPILMKRILPRCFELTYTSLKVCAFDIGLYLSVERSVDSDFFLRFSV